MCQTKEGQVYYIFKRNFVSNRPCIARGLILWSEGEMLSTERKQYKSLLIDKDSWKKLKQIALEEEKTLIQVIRDLLILREQTHRSS